MISLKKYIGYDTDTLSLAAAERDLAAQQRTEKLQEAHSDKLRLVTEAFKELAEQGYDIREIYDSSPSTKLHCYEVGVTAYHLAESLGLDKASREQLALDGVLHDIGKFLHADVRQLVDESRSLSPEEKIVVAAHTTIGADFIAKIAPEAGVVAAEHLQCALPAVLYHHDSRLDDTYLECGNDATETIKRVMVIIAADLLCAITDMSRGYQSTKAASEKLHLSNKDDRLTLAAIIAAKLERLPKDKEFTTLREAILRFCANKESLPKLYDALLRPNTSSREDLHTSIGTTALTPDS